MPNTAAAEAIGRFVQTLHCEPQQTAYREIVTAFFAKFSTWYCESKSILKQKGDRSLVPKNYQVKFSFQPTDRLKDDQALKDRLNDMELVASEMSHQLSEFYIEMKTYVNTDRKLELIEMLACSLPRMAKLILAECGFSQDYGPHNLVADVLTSQHGNILKFWCDLPYFIDVYKRINRCGRAPEDASAMMNRLFPPTAAAQPEVDDDDDDGTTQQDTLTHGSVIRSQRNQFETPSRGDGNNAEEVSAISTDTPSTSQPHKLDGSGFMTATQFADFIKRLKPGDDFKAKADEFCKTIALNTPNPNNDNPNNSSKVPSTIGHPTHSVTPASRPSPSPLRVLRNPYTNKVYFSREYTPREIEHMNMMKFEASRLERCTSLCLINSIREDNFIEDSFRTTTMATGDDSCATKKLFQCLKPHTFPTNSHTVAIEKLYDHSKNIFVFPRNYYIQQYLHNKKVRDMKKLEKAFSSEQLASDTAQHMVRAVDLTEDNTNTDTLISTFVNERVDKSVRKRAATHDAKVLSRIEALESKLAESNDKLQNAEKVINSLSTGLHQVKGAVPVTTPGNQIIELADDSPMKPPAKKVRVTLPPKESVIRQDPPRVDNPYKKKRQRKAENRRDNGQADEAGPDSSLNNASRHQEKRNGPRHWQRKRKQHERERQSSTRKR